jgi:acyl-coenzyme A synthetase/AMP-(fatty) acid ligase/3-hydroxymyristoyl/3-hydroxydecanoyl-(acyl carrier protein) dehydratase
MTMFAPFHTLHSANRSSDHPVCHDGQRFVLWQEFSDRISAHAAHLSSRQELRWLIAIDNPLEFAVLLLALLYAKKQVVIPPNSQPGTLAELSKTYDAIANEKVQCNSARGSAPTDQIDPDGAIIDIYTSGSTGEPKQIRKALSQIEIEVASLESLWGNRLGQACVVASAPHYHFYGLLFRLFWPLSAGRPFDAITCTYPDTLIARLALLGDTALVSSPALLTRLPELIPLASLQPAPKLIFSSGGPLPASAADHFHRQFGQAPTEVFGSTETGGIAWRRQEGDDGWTPMPGIHVGSEPDGALSLRSPYLIASTPWRMDDAIELLSDGRFILRGRLDRTVKIEEKRLSLSDMEARLAAHPWVSAASAVALSGRRQSVGAVLVLSEQGRHQMAVIGQREIGLTLRRYLADHFALVLIPKRWRFRNQLPFNERGKLTQASLSELFTNVGANKLLPEVLAVRRETAESAQVSLDLHITADVVHFDGHFPMLPILPGVIQIDWALHYSRKYLALNGEFIAMENVKFQAVTLPDTKVVLRLTWNAARRHLEFSYATSHQKYSTGRIVFGEAS